MHSYCFWTILGVYVEYEILVGFTYCRGSGVGRFRGCREEIVMIQVLHDLEGSAFITGILLLLVLLGFLAMAWLMFGSSVLVGLVVCWVIVAFVPFIFRVVNLWLLSPGSSVLDN